MHRHIARSVDLTEQARLADVPDEEFPFDGEPAFDRFFDLLLRALHRGGQHVVLVGERGTAHSALLAELARRAASGTIPMLRDSRIVTADVRFTLPEEARGRLLAILSHVASRNELILAVDGFASLLRSDRGSTNKPALLAALGDARCRIVGIVSPHEYEEIIGDDADMLERFARVDVSEPDVPTAIKLLGHYAEGLKERFGLAIEPEAIAQSVLLSSNYILNERLPSKALKLLHRVCEEIDYDRTQLGRSRDQVTADDVVRIVAEVTGVPEETLRGIAQKSDFVASLQEEIVGQDHAVREVAVELGLIKAGLTDPDKPASVMLFVGQTGTGKTEMAKALARFYSASKRLRTYTLGNFVEPHSVAGIIGVPPGYVGHDQGGRIVNDLNSDPYCVFLLDEADKAHPDALQPFLNLFDEGWVRDQRGVQGYADQSIFILTTNVGQRMIADMAKQGKSLEEMTTRMKEALSQIRHGKSNRPVFAPEFLARIKRVIVFQPLDREAMAGICRKLVRSSQATWRQRRQKELEIPGSLVDYIGDESHRLNEKSDGREGGRIVRKLMTDLIDANIQRAVAENPDEYRRCEAVIVEHSPGSASATGNGDSAVPDIRVSFRSPISSERSASSASGVVQ